MPSDYFGISDQIKALNAPAGFEDVHQPGFSWAVQGDHYADTTKLGDVDWNRIIAQFRGLFTIAGVDLSDLPAASPFVLREALIRAIDAALPLGPGNVVGPDDSADNELALFDSVTGKQLKRGVLLATLATLASPAFTGNPTAPTQAPGNVSTRLATTAFVQAALDALVDAAPGALNTLNELAAALANDPDFAATMTNALAAKAPLDSPALTGNPTAPTPAFGNSSTLLATTAFVQGELGTANGAPDAVLADQKPSGTGGGDATSGTWQARVLNTKVRDPGALITLDVNEIDFTPSVDGWIEWTCPAFNIDLHQTRLRNVTDGVTAAMGSAAYAGGGNVDHTGNSSAGGGPVTAGKTYRIEHRCTEGQTGNGVRQRSQFR